LTGRYIPVELFTFSFVEFLSFLGHTVTDLKRLTTVEMAHLQQVLGEYLHMGGIPQPLKYPELPLLRTLYDDILYRDIATRQDPIPIGFLGGYLHPIDQRFSETRWKNDRTMSHELTIMENRNHARCDFLDPV